jgi:hypothetical protein
MNLREVIVLTATYYGKDLIEPVLEMYVDDLSDLPEAEVIEAYRTYRRNPKNRAFPLPAQIREIIEPEVSPEGMANEAISRIQEAITRFGYARGGEAQLFIGSLGWAVVKRFGGWENLCRHHGVEIQPGTFFAQARTMALSQMEFAKVGRFDEPPALPFEDKALISAPQDGAGLKSIGEILDWAKKEQKNTSKGQA